MSPSTVDQQIVEGSEQGPRATGDTGQLEQAVGGALAPLPPLQLLAGDRSPELIDDGRRFPGDLRDGQLEMLGPDVPESMRVLADYQKVPSSIGMWSGPTPK